MQTQGEHANASQTGLSWPAGCCEVTVQHWTTPKLKTFRLNCKLCFSWSWCCYALVRNDAYYAVLVNGQPNRSETEALSVEMSSLQGNQNNCIAVWLWFWAGNKLNSLNPTSRSEEKLLMRTATVQMKQQRSRALSNASPQSGTIHHPLVVTLRQLFRSYSAGVHWQQQSSVQWF